MNNQELIEIAEKLAAKTDQKQANWNELSISGGSADQISGYKLTLPRSTIHIIYRYYSSAPDDYSFTILNEDRKSVASLRIEPDEDGYETLKKLYESARRYHLRLDETLSDIRNAIDSDEEIGGVDPSDIPF